jgi:predicted MPP superfamily phosphohydrolase
MPLPWDRRFIRAITRPPFSDEVGRKPLPRLFRARRHVVRRLTLAIPAWPRTARPLRIVFLSDFHTGSHADDLDRLTSIVAEAAACRPDLALYGGDFMNMMAFGGGRVPPRVIAAILAALEAPLGRFAVLGNHDYDYGEAEVAAALRATGITVLEDERRELEFHGAAIGLIGIPDARVHRTAAADALARLGEDSPTLVLAHDPYWFTHLPPGPHLMLAGHTHGGQVCLPGIGPLINMSWAPLRWTHGLIVEGGRHLYVTSGLGMSGLPLRLGTVAEYVVADVTAAGKLGSESIFPESIFPSPDPRGSR